MPLLVTVLALGTFLMGTSEFVVVGLLPDLATDLSISISDAGLSITAFAVGMIAAPVTAVATLKIAQRLTLVLALVLFAVGHVVVATSTDLRTIIIARFITALATGAFWSIAAAVAARVAGPGAGARAMGYVVSGGILATVLGVPLGSFAGQIAGWRGPFWALTILALVVSLAVARYVPGGQSDTHSLPLRTQLAALRRGRLWVVLTACALINAAVLSTYAFIAPLLTDRAGLPPELLPLGLLVFGLGSLTGTLNSGRFGDRAPFATALTGGTVVLLALSALCFLSTSAVAAIGLLTVVGLAGMGTNPVLMSLAVRYARNAPTLATSLATSLFNVGTAAGSWVTAQAIDSAGTIAVPVVGAAFALLLLAPLVLLPILDRRRNVDTRGIYSTRAHDAREGLIAP
jgi:DHA1 family inner membrane transport protein